MSSIICLDTETTGLTPGSDEIIQLSIVGTDGFVYDQYFKPQYVTSWPEAANVTGIYPEHVADKPVITEPEPFNEIQSILSQASVIIGYHLNFDLNFLRAAGFNVAGAELNDPMYDFAKMYGEQHPEENLWLEWKGMYKNKNLTFAANYFGYAFSAHNSLEDVRATLHVWENLGNMGLITSYNEASLAAID